MGVAWSRATWLPQCPGTEGSHRELRGRQTVLSAISVAINQIPTIAKSTLVVYLKCCVVKIRRRSIRMEILESARTAEWSMLPA